MKVSIITVVLNNCLYVKDAIESVINQSYNNIEYIVIDGGSTDGSIEIIQSYASEISTIISETDNGIYDAMNKGLSIATGDIVAFLNADDFYTNSEVIQNIVNEFRNSSIDACYADLDYISRTDKNKIVRKWRSGSFNINRFKKGWMPPHPTFFAKKSIYNAYGGYNQLLNSSADYELMLRFCYVNKINVSHLNAVIVKMRLGGQSNRSLKNRILANLQDRKAWEINGIRPTWYTFLLKPLSKIKQYL
ncbi:MAG: glycosyltransferase [Bacteroidia bacterium]|nr:glycosyltransferase [Bacteroidia bacterium]